MLGGFNNQTTLEVVDPWKDKNYITTRKGQIFEVGFPKNHHQRRAQAAIARRWAKKLRKRLAKASVSVPSIASPLA